MRRGVVVRNCEEVRVERRVRGLVRENMICGLFFFFLVDHMKIGGCEWYRKNRSKMSSNLKRSLPHLSYVIRPL